MAPSAGWTEQAWLQLVCCALYQIPGVPANFRGQELRPELPEDRGQSPVVGGSGLEDPGLGIVSIWAKGRQSRRSNDIGSKTGGPEAREPVDPGVGTNWRAQELVSPWRKGQEIDEGTSPRSSENAGGYGGAYGKYIKMESEINWGLWISQQMGMYKAEGQRKGAIL
ncbi:hypothetical protein DFH29DRAFT_872711 [Suillus ampliporus]|nr:hypothetical protein DFH29DRAFT_872711 [Suillus ampliporus]